MRMGAHIQMDNKAITYRLFISIGITYECPGYPSARVRVRPSENCKRNGEKDGIKNLCVDSKVYAHWRLQLSIDGLAGNCTYS